MSMRHQYCQPGSTRIGHHQSQLIRSHDQYQILKLSRSRSKGRYVASSNHRIGIQASHSSSPQQVIKLPASKEVDSSNHFLFLLLKKQQIKKKLIITEDPINNETLPLERLVERVIFDCRFFTLLAVVGSLFGSLLCFCKGCGLVLESFSAYFHATWQGLSTGEFLFLLVEAIDVYLMGTVMLIFGMGIYELFVSNIEVPSKEPLKAVASHNLNGSNLFGLFRLQKRPKWLNIGSLEELKTKLGHVIIMSLLVGMFEKSRKIPINSGLDLLCFSASILFSSACLFLVTRLTSNH